MCDTIVIGSSKSFVINIETLCRCTLMLMFIIKQQYSNAVMLIVYIFNSNGAGKTRDRMHL